MRGQGNPKERSTFAFTHAASHPDSAMVTFNDLLREGQTQTAAMFGFGGKERLKYLLRMLAWDAMAVVRNHELNAILHPADA